MIDLYPTERTRRSMQRVREFAQDNGISEAKTWDMIAKGELKAVKVGSATRIRAQDAEAWRESLQRRVL